MKNGSVAREAARTASAETRRFVAEVFEGRVTGARDRLRRLVASSRLAGDDLAAACEALEDVEAISVYVRATLAECWREEFGEEDCACRRCRSRRRAAGIASARERFRAVG